MKNIIILLLISLLIISCQKEKQNTSQTLPEIQEAAVIDVGQNRRKNIATIGEDIDVWYETDDSVVYAKKSTSEQIVIVCDNADYYYSQKHLIGQIHEQLERRSKSVENSIKFTEVHVLPTAKERAYKTEEFYDEYYKITVTRYYVTYRDMYGNFNV